MFSLSSFVFLCFSLFFLFSFFLELFFFTNVFVYLCFFLNFFFLSLCFYILFFDFFVFSFVACSAAFFFVLIFWSLNFARGFSCEFLCKIVNCWKPLGWYHIARNLRLHSNSLFLPVLEDYWSARNLELHSNSLFSRKLERLVECKKPWVTLKFLILSSAGKISGMQETSGFTAIPYSFQCWKDSWNARNLG